MLVRVSVLLAVTLIAWFFVWTVDPEGNRPVLEATGEGYYNLLTRGFLKGQTALDRVVEPAMLALKDPYNPAERAGKGLHDASCYQGRYFIYFGVTPVVVAFAPVRLLTGQFIDERFVIVGFAWAGFLLSVTVLLDVRRRHFAGAPGWVLLLGVLALGLATMVPPLLRRPSIWEVPIAAGYAGFMLTLLCTWRAIRAKRGGWIWLGAASLAMGLTVGARPTYLPGAVVLLAPIALRWWVERPNPWRGLAAAALGPIIAVGAGLAAYNYVRFGSITEFGQTYQMAGDDIRGLKLFGPGYMAYNFRIYILAAAGLSPFFPFITVIDPPVAPTGQFGIEDPYGLLPCLPWVVLAAVALRARPGSGAGHELTFWVAGTLAAALATMAVVFCFGGACGRYMVDFTPALTLLAGVGALALMVRNRGFLRRMSGGLVVVLAVWSASFGLLASFQHNGLLQVEHPKVYRGLALAFNRPGDLWDRLAGIEYGPVEMTVVFPEGKAGEMEPLLVSGRSFRSDYFYVHYLSEDSVRFAYEHTNYGGASSEAVKIRPGARHTLLIETGSLYPPADHPYFSQMPRAQARLRQRRISVRMDGVVVFQRNADLYDAVSRYPDIGTSAGRPGFPQPFSGEIVNWRVRPEVAPVVAIDEYGPIEIKITLPPFRGVRNEPLVSSGEAGRGDLVYVRFLDERTVAFGYDHWGYGGFETEPVAVDPQSEQTVTVDYGALHPAGRTGSSRIELKLNGKIVVDRPAAFYPCEPYTVLVGFNSIGASTATPRFTGDVVGFRRVTSP
jgi:hypothetical protein